jgi:apolipoprotein N-acyltransferase
MLFLSSRFRRYFSVFLAGLITGCTQLPLSAGLLGLIGISLFLKLSEYILPTLKEKFLFSWFFGVGYFCISLYWICFALFVEISYFWWLVPIAFFGMPIILSCFFATTHLIWDGYKETGLIKVIYFCFAWMAAELARSFLFTGFPWALLGYVWGPFDSIAQLSSVTGIYGLSILALGIGVLPYLYGALSFKKALSIALLVLSLIGIITIWGKARLKEAPIPTNFIIRIVQPNIAQTLKWDPREQKHNLHTLIDLSQSPSAEPLSAIIWPESAVPYELSDTLRLYLKQIIPQKCFLVTGILRHDEPHVWNSLMVLNDKGDVKATYDKSHLVPFGEYIPFRAIADKAFLGKLKKVTHGLKDFTPGTGVQTLDTAPLPPFSPLICYEVIFPGHVANYNDVPPRWILNLTNDGWYGDSAGPYQHLEMSRFRAIEEGLPVVRAANTGISAIFDAYGQKVASLGYGTEGIIDANLPPSLLHRTFFSRFKGYELYAFLFILASAFLYQRARFLK